MLPKAIYYILATGKIFVFGDIINVSKAPCKLFIYMSFPISTHSYVGNWKDKGSRSFPVFYVGSYHCLLSCATAGSLVKTSSCHHEWPDLNWYQFELGNNGNYKIPLVATAKREQGHAFSIRRHIAKRSLVQLYLGKGSSLAIYKQQILNTWSIAGKLKLVSVQIRPELPSC
jgi:hypothetical protein